MNRYDPYASSCSGHLDQFVSDDRLSDEIHTNGYTQIHTAEQTHTHKHTPYKHLHAHKRHTAYIHPHTHTHSRTSTYNQTHTSPTHTDPYAFYLSRLSLPHAHSSAPYVCSFNLSKLFPCGVIRSYNFCGDAPYTSLLATSFRSVPAFHATGNGNSGSCTTQ